MKTLNITEKTGKLVDIRAVTDANDLMIINKSGVAIRVKVADLSIIGRATQGVKLIDLSKRGDEIASVCSVVSEEEENKAEEHADHTHEVLPQDDSSVSVENDEISEMTDANEPE